MGRRWPWSKDEEPSVKTVESLDAKTRGKAFKLFEEGKGMVFVASDLGLDPSVARALYENYVVEKNKERELAATASKGVKAPDAGPPYKVFKWIADPSGAMRGRRRAKVRVWDQQAHDTKPVASDIGHFAAENGNGYYFILDSAGKQVGTIIVSDQNFDDPNPDEPLDPYAVDTLPGRANNPDDAMARSFVGQQDAMKRRYRAIGDAYLKAGRPDLADPWYKKVEAIDNPASAAAPPSPWGQPQNPYAPQPQYPGAPFGAPPGYPPYPGYQAPVPPKSAKEELKDATDLFTGVLAAVDKVRMSPGGGGTGAVEDPEIAKAKAWSGIFNDGIKTAKEQLVDPYLGYLKEDAAAGEDLDRETGAAGGSNPSGINWEAIGNVPGVQSTEPEVNPGPVETNLGEDDGVNGVGGEVESGGESIAWGDDEIVGAAPAAPPAAPVKPAAPPARPASPATNTGGKALKIGLEERYVLTNVFPKLANAIRKSRKGSKDHSAAVVAEDYWRQISKIPNILRKRIYHSVKEGAGSLIGKYRSYVEKQIATWDKYAALLDQIGEKEFANRYDPIKGKSMKGTIEHLRSYKKLKGYWTEFTSPDGKAWLIAFCAALKGFFEGTPPPAAVSVPPPVEPEPEAQEVPEEEEEEDWAIGDDDEVEAAPPATEPEEISAPSGIVPGLPPASPTAPVVALEEGFCGSCGTMVAGGETRCPNPECGAEVKSVGTPTQATPTP